RRKRGRVARARAGPGLAGVSVVARARQRALRPGRRGLLDRRRHHAYPPRGQQRGKYREAGAVSRCAAGRPGRAAGERRSARIRSGVSEFARRMARATKPQVSGVGIITPSKSAMRTRQFTACLRQPVIVVAIAWPIEYSRITAFLNLLPDSR